MHTAEVQPTCSTIPIASCPMMSPFAIPCISLWYRCRSEPHTVVAVTLINASPGSVIWTWGTESTDTEALPFQHRAFIIVVGSRLACTQMGW